MEVQKTQVLEILELGITKEQSFGINVSNVREITTPYQVTEIPRSHPFISGLIQMRDEVLPVVNLSKVLDVAELEKKQGIFIVAEFNHMKIVFHVGWVNQICRITPEQIEEPGAMFTSSRTSLTGIVKLEDKIIQLLDFEKILMEVNPQLNVNQAE